MTHVRVWRFEPVPGREAEFAAAYSGEGPWAKLFEQAGGFVSTTLLAPDEPGGAWLTLDRWQSRAAFETFQETRGDAYRALDAALADLTVTERFIGAFEEPG